MYIYIRNEDLYVDDVQVVMERGLACLSDFLVQTIVLVQLYFPGEIGNLA